MSARESPQADPGLSSQGLFVSTVDYHTAGEPFRIVTGGVLPIPGSTILEKRRYAAEHLDHIRRLLVYEPRGHSDMYGCFVTDPVDGGGDIGTVFFHNAGYSTACGHGTIALATWAVESGVVKVSGPETKMVIDVPSGRLHVVAKTSGTRVEAVRFRNVPAFVFDRGVNVSTSKGQVQVDIAFGGAFYASLDARSCRLAVRREDLPALISLGREIKDSLNGSRTIEHPVESGLRDIYGVIFYEEIENDPSRQRNVTVFADGEVDRSPCGSGTSARLALLTHSGALPSGQVLTHEGILRTAFQARVVGVEDVGGSPAVVTEIEGSARLTGFHHFVLREDDELGEGFLLR